MDKYVLFYILITSIAIFNVIVGIILAFFTPKRNQIFGVIDEITLSDDSTWEFVNKTYGLISLGLGGIGIAIIIPLMLSLEFIPIKKVFPVVIISILVTMIIARTIAISLAKKKTIV